MQRRSRESLERILFVAGEGFDELGVDRCSMEEISRRAGVSVGALYRFFPSKPALLDAMAERYHAEHALVFAGLFEPESLLRTAEEITDDFFDRFVDLVNREPGWRGLTRAGILFTGPPQQEWTARLERYIDMQAPGLPRERLRAAALTYQMLTGWLMLHSAAAEPGFEASLREARTLLVGYMKELRRQGG
jgi:AcrR family transcriptional regulator